MEEEKIQLCPACEKNSVRKDFVDIWDRHITDSKLCRECYNNECMKIKMVDLEPIEDTMNIYQRLHAIQGKIEDMKKEGWNDYSHYQYLTAAQVVSRVKELMNEYKVIFTCTSELLKFEEVGKSQKGAIVRLSYAFINIENPTDRLSGQFDSFAGDTGDKQVFKAITGGIKYIYTSTFSIANEDDPEKDNQGKKRVKVETVQDNPELIVAKIKKILLDKDPKLTGPAALKLFRELSGLTWNSWQGITLAQAKAGYATLMANLNTNGK